MIGRKLLTAGTTAVLVFGLLIGAAGAVLATNPGQGFFELDASNDLSNGTHPKAAVTDNAANTIPDDWDRVAADAGLATNGAVHSHATASTFDAETTATGSANNATIFTGGGSKDQQAINKWAWKDASGGLPDKDNLLHAMSARYGAGPTAHIYFAADRFDNSGDAQIGFWFFNNQIGPQAGGGFGPGAHKAGEVPHNANNAGDILVLSDFTNGGSQPTIRVFEFVGSGGSDGSLNLLGGNATDVRDCGVVSTDDFCASVNNLDGAVAPWLFRNKSGQTTFGHGEFYEGGLNLTTLGLQNECFSSFLAETRSSQSVTATLKDFVSGPFQDCSTSVVTTPSVGSGGASIGVGGSIAVHDSALVTVNGTSTFSGTLAFHICGPIATGNCQTGGTAVAAAAGVNPVIANGSYDSANFTIHSAGRYCWRADLTIQSPAGLLGDSDPGDATSTTECFVINPVTPDLSTDASTGPVALGQSISDTAHLSGTANKPNGSPAGGSITFTAYGPDDCTTLAFTSAAIPVTGDGDYVSGSFTPTAAGTYTFKATYTGDPPNTNGASATACPDADEAVDVSPVTPTLTTQSSADPVDLGTAISDTAHLTGTALEPDGTTKAQGTISFTAYGPGDCTTVAFGPVTINVDGDGFYGGAGSAAEFTPSSPGKYTWVATYSGDSPNTLGAGPTACPDANEDVTVNSFQPTIETAQSFIPNDSATVSSTGGDPLAGTVHFQVFESSDCSGTAIYSQDMAVAGNSPQTVDTTNTAVSTTSAHVSWLVSYDSTNPAQNSIGATCVEKTTLTITNQ